MSKHEHCLPLIQEVASGKGRSCLHILCWRFLQPHQLQYN